jgi:starch synthase
MNIVMAASEMTPFAKTGGLGDVLGSLPIALAKRGHHVTVFLPYYRSIPCPKPEMLFESHIQMGSQTVCFGIVRLTRVEGVEVYGIRKEEYFDRSQLYGLPERSYEDNAKRFIFFGKAVVQAIQSLSLRAHVVHAHDWQAALIPIYLREQMQKFLLPKMGVVFTIHNLAYQGIFNAEEFSNTNLEGHYFNTNSLEYFGQLNLMKGGILYSDAVTTVSQRYALEIQTPEYGCGLEGVLASRASALHGILNGVDYSLWNPQKDPHLKTRFNPSKLSERTKCRAALAKEMKIESTAQAPIFGIVSRFAEQKGMDLLLKTFPEMLERGATFAVLGNGEAHYEQAFRKLATRYPKQFRLKVGFDEGLAHRIYAGSDFLLMPSLYEPCGLSQLYAMRYGCIPIVRATGGLDDTVQQWEPNTLKGNGLKFEKADAASLLTAFNQAMELFQQPKPLTALRKNAIKSRFSWEDSARNYENLYQSLSPHA